MELKVKVCLYNSDEHRGVTGTFVEKHSAHYFVSHSNYPILLNGKKFEVEDVVWEVKLLGGGVCYATDVEIL